MYTSKACIFKIGEEVSNNGKIIEEHWNRLFYLHKLCEEFSHFDEEVLELNGSLVFLKI